MYFDFIYTHFFFPHTIDGNITTLRFKKIIKLLNKTGMLLGSVGMVTYTIGVRILRLLHAK
jgi:hypothetical protein